MAYLFFYFFKTNQRSASQAEEELKRGRTKLRFVLADELSFSIGLHLVVIYFFHDYITVVFSSRRQTGKQIQSVINSAYKIERQAGGT